MHLCFCSTSVSLIYIIMESLRKRWMPQPITCQIAKSAHFVYRGGEFLITAPQCHPLIYGNTAYPHRPLDKLVTLRVKLGFSTTDRDTEWRHASLVFIHLSPLWPKVFQLVPGKKIKNTGPHTHYGTINKWNLLIISTRSCLSFH